MVVSAPLLALIGGAVSDGGREYACARLRLSRQCRACGRPHQAAMLYALEANEQIGKALHALRLAVDHEHFKAGASIEMRVAG